MSSKSFYCMVFTRYLAGKIWSSSIYIQYIRLRNTINLARFLYQISLTGKFNENDYLYVQNTEVH